MRKFILLFTFVMCCLSTIHAKGKISVSAPSVVSTSEQFQLTYTVTDADCDEIVPPSLSSVFDVLDQSTSHSYQNINGHSSSSQSLIFNLRAKKQGNWIVPPARIMIGGKAYMSRPIRIKVQKGGTSSTNKQSTATEPSFPTMPNPNMGNPSPDVMFLRTDVSKRQVYRLEPFVATINLYSIYQFKGTFSQIPKFTNCVSEYKKTNPDKDSRVVVVKGHKYVVAPLLRFLITPTKSGAFNIGKFGFQSELNVNNGMMSVDVPHDFESAPVSVNVSELPPSPSEYTGAVGNMSLTSEIIPQSGIRAHEAITFRLVISGVGNLKMVSIPNFKFPSDFDSFGSKVNNDGINFDANKEFGKKCIDYVVVPRKAGSYTLPSVSLVCFNPSTRQYVTLRTKPIQIKVGKGNPQIKVSESSDLVNTDINYIKTTNLTVQSKNSCFYGTWGYWLCLILPSIFVLLLAMLLRKRRIERADVVGRRTRLANKQAVIRLKQAKIYLEENQQSQFYEEVMRALWEYTSNKLNIPVSNLSKDNIAIELEARHIDQTIISDFISLLNICEFARFSPADSSESMDQIYQKAEMLIGHLEEELKV